MTMMDSRYSEFFRKMARDRWYSLFSIMSETDYIMLKDLAKEANFPSVESLRDYFHRWGREMSDKYGKLPYCRLNSHKYDRFMEMK